MGKASLLCGKRKMLFEEVYSVWTELRLTRGDAARGLEREALPLLVSPRRRGVRARLGVEMIPAYSPEARGRSERAFGTQQGCLPKELAAAGVMDIVSANRYLHEVYLPVFNAEFAQPAREVGRRLFPARTWRRWMASCARFTSAVWARITVCGSKGGYCNCPQTVTGATTPRSG